MKILQANSGGGASKDNPLPLQVSAAYFFCLMEAKKNNKPLNQLKEGHLKKIYDELDQNLLTKYLA